MVLLEIKVRRQDKCYTLSTRVSLSVLEYNACLCGRPAEILQLLVLRRGMIIWLDARRPHLAEDGISPRLHVSATWTIHLLRYLTSRQAIAFARVGSAISSA